MADIEKKNKAPMEIRAEIVDVHNKMTKTTSQEVALVAGDQAHLITKANAQDLCKQLNQIVKQLLQEN